MDEPIKELPAGLGFSMAMNLNAMNNFTNLSEKEKQQVINESKQVKSKDEMNRLVNRLAENRFH